MNTYLRSARSPTVWFCSIAKLASFTLLFFGGSLMKAQTRSAQKTVEPCDEMRAGVVVETMANHSEAERAGVAKGDVIRAWTRGDVKGEIRSPFDLADVELEQQPRGQVTLEGTRGKSEQTWAMGPDTWGIVSRPNLASDVLAAYEDGQQLAEANKPSEAAAKWRAAAPPRHDQCGWLHPWFLMHAGETLTRAHQWEEADALFKSSIDEATEVGPQIRATLQRSWITSFDKRTDWPSEAKQARRAMEEESLNGKIENLSIAKNATTLAVTLYRIGDLAQADEYATQALKIRQKLAPGSLDVARSLTWLGNIALWRGDIAKARAYQLQALDVAQKLAPNGLDLAMIQGDLGNVEEDNGDFDKAEELYLQEFEITQKLDPLGKNSSAALINLGNVAYYRGDLDQADKYYRQCVAIDQANSPDSGRVASDLNNLGNVAFDRGDLVKAEEYNLRALEIRRRIAPGSLTLASTLNNLGNVAYGRGDLDKAWDYYTQALAIKQKMNPDSLGVGSSMGNIANVAADRRDFTTAKDYASRALAIQDKVSPGSIYVSVTLGELGDIARKSGNLVEAEGYYNRSFALLQKLAPGSTDAAQSAMNLGDILRQRGDSTKASDYYNLALEIRKKLAPESEGYAESLAALAGMAREAGKSEEARRLYGQSVDVLDRQLAHLGGSASVRAEFRARHTDYYFNYADLLVEGNNPELAFEVLERSRARTLLEMLAGAHVDILQGADPALIAKERSLQANLTAKTNRKVSLLEGEHTSQQLTALNREIDSLLSQYQELEGQIRTTTPRYAALTQPKTLTAGETQRMLDPQTVLLYYALGDKHSFAFVITPTSFDSYPLPNRKDVEGTANHFYERLTARNRWMEGETTAQRKTRLERDEAEYRQMSAVLSGMVLGPVIPKLLGKRLLIVADGALQYVPFAALPVPVTSGAKEQVPLVAEHEIVSLPSASVAALLRQQAELRVPPAKEVAILADPVFDKNDPRVGKIPSPGFDGGKRPAANINESAEHLSRSVQDLEFGKQRSGDALARLAFSRREAGAIMAVAKPGTVMEALDFRANREMALSNELGQYRIVHFATHGLLDNEHPELSGLVFSLVDPSGKPVEGFVDLQDVYNLNIPADLVVLSACETGLGRPIGGEGLVGLTRGFMYAGAIRVVASLWRVDDAATSELMAEFYKAMLQGGLSPGKALRQAQLDMLKHRHWSDPYYWAAFTLQGEWN